MEQADINELKREDIWRTASRFLMDTDEEHKMITDIWIYRGDKEVAKVTYLWQMPCGGEIAVGIDYSGHTEEKGFDELSLDWQTQIVNGIFPDYKPMIMIKKNTDSGQRENVIVISADQLDGAAWSIIDETMRGRLENELEEYRKSYPHADDALKDAIDRLSKGKIAFFNHYEYFFEELGNPVPDIDDIIKLTDEQMALVKQMESLYQKMQEAGIALAVNDSLEVITYNSREICDVAPRLSLLEGIPDGYEYANIDKLHAMFPIWESEDLYLKRR